MSLESVSATGVVSDNISMICVHGKERWEFGGESHKFYKFVLTRSKAKAGNF